MKEPKEQVKKPDVQNLRPVNSTELQDIESERRVVRCVVRC